MRKGYYGVKIKKRKNKWIIEGETVIKMKRLFAIEDPIVIGSNVWIGAHVIILKD